MRLVVGARRQPAVVGEDLALGSPRLFAAQVDIVENPALEKSGADFRRRLHRPKGFSVEINLNRFAKHHRIPADELAPAPKLRPVRVVVKVHLPRIDVVASELQMDLPAHLCRVPVAEIPLGGEDAQDLRSALLAGGEPSVLRLRAR